MLKTISFMKSYDNWKELLVAEPYCLKIDEETNYVLLTYSQTESDFSLDIVKECRGLIVDKNTFLNIFLHFS